MAATARMIWRGMRKVLARPWVGVRVCLFLLLFVLKVGIFLAVIVDELFNFALALNTLSFAPVTMQQATPYQKK